jgi:hypothetical protein
MDDHEETLEGFDEEFDKVKKILKNIMENKFDYYDHLKTEDSIKLNLTLSYAINSLYFILMKLNGKGTKDHEVFSEMKLIKAKMCEFDKIVAKNKSSVPILNQPPPSSSKSKIDTDAAQRIVNSTLSYNKMLEKQINPESTIKKRERDIDNRGELKYSRKKEEKAKKDSSKILKKRSHKSFVEQEVKPEDDKYLNFDDGKTKRKFHKSVPLPETTHLTWKGHLNH